MEHPDLADTRQREPSVAGAPWCEPVRGGHPDARLANRPGQDQLEAMLNGSTPRPPISRLTGMQLVEFSAGSAMFTMPVSDWLVGADGAIPLGPLAIPADAAMACAIMTLLPAGTSLTTSELGLRQVRAVAPGDILVARARTLEAGPAVALAEVTLTDDDGTLIAHGGSLCVRLPALTAPPQPDDPPASPSPNPHPHPHPHPSLSEELDPWERPLPAGAGPGAPPPLWQLTGLRELDAPHGEVAFALPATRWLCAPPPGRVQGGAVATLADAAIMAAIQTVEPAAGRFEAGELKLNYLRPLASDGREASARGRLIHGGRRTAVASAEVVDADGRMIAVITGSAVTGSST